MGEQIVGERVGDILFWNGCRRPRAVVLIVRGSLVVVVDIRSRGADHKRGHGSTQIGRGVTGAIRTRTGIRAKAVSPLGRHRRAHNGRTVVLLKVLLREPNKR